MNDAATRKRRTGLIALLAALLCALALAVSAVPLFAEGDDAALEEATVEEAEVGEIEPVGAEETEADEDGGADDDVSDLALAEAATADADGTNIASGTSGTCSWVIDSNGVLTISPADGYEDGYLESVSSISGCPWNSYRSEITAVVVKDGAHAGESAYCLFYNCSHMTSFTDENTGTGFATSTTTSLAHTFGNCSSLARVTGLSSWDTSSLTTLVWTFGGCSSLGSLDLSGWDTSSVTTLDGTFTRCSSLESLDLSGWNTKSVTTRDGTFIRCSSLSSITLGQNWDWTYGSDKSNYCSNAYYGALPTPTATCTGKWVDDEGDYTAMTASELATSWTSDYADTWVWDYSHILTKTEQVDATCTDDGAEAYWTCSVCGKLFSDEEGTEIDAPVAIAATGHDYDYSNITWTWAEDYSSATATVVCNNDSSHTLTVEAAVTSATTDATCTEDGSTVYTATIADGDGNEYTDTQTVTIDATGHTEGEALVENVVEATYTEEGSYDSVVYCSVCGEELSRETVTIDATGHTEGEPVIENETDESYDLVVYCTVCGEELSRETLTIEAEEEAEPETGEVAAEEDADAEEEAEEESSDDEDLAQTGDGTASTVLGVAAMGAIALAAGIAATKRRRA